MPYPTDGMTFDGLRKLLDQAKGKPPLVCPRCGHSAGLLFDPLPGPTATLCPGCSQVFMIDGGALREPTDAELVDAVTSKEFRTMLRARKLAQQLKDELDRLAGPPRNPFGLDGKPLSTTRMSKAWELGFPPPPVDGWPL